MEMSVALRALGAASSTLHGAKQDCYKDNCSRWKFMFPAASLSSIKLLILAADRPASKSSANVWSS
jgi:hypothetical protein